MWLVSNQSPKEGARMNSHKNARTTPHTRALLARRVIEQGQSPCRVADELGISLRTVYKWVARFRAEGLAGLENRSSVARRVAHRLPDAVVELIGQLRRTARMTARQIAKRLQQARSTVAAVLKRLGLHRLKLLDPPEPVRRYERKRPGELIHLDVKKLGRIARVGHRITGDRRRRVRGIGWEFAHVCIDDHSRLAYVEVLSNEKGATATGFLQRALAWFRNQGVTVQQVMTDNGSCYVSDDFARQCTAAGLRHIRTRPYTPKTNGKAERFIQTLIREWAYGRVYNTSEQRTAQLPRWLDHYNHRRPHGGIGHQPPINRISTPTDRESTTREQRS
jgi:transposase InsO family protein